MGKSDVLIEKRGNSLKTDTAELLGNGLDLLESNDYEFIVISICFVVLHAAIVFNC